MTNAAKKKILVSDKLTAEGLAILADNGTFEVHNKPDITPEDLVKEIGQYSALVIRSRSRVTKEVLANAANLVVVGRAGVGVDNVDVPEATTRGVIVMNTPDGNTLSTAEHSFSMILSLARRIPYADATMKAGKWEKKSITGMEVFGKTLGVCGLGRIGREVAARARAFGMKVVGYDPFVSQDMADKIRIEVMDNVDDVVKQADIVTVHTPLNAQTKGMIGRKQIEAARKGVLIVNCARGGIVDEQALLEGLQSGKVGGAALDVFETEPLAADHPFRTMANVVLTPHLGAATVEAQDNVARDVAAQIVDCLKGIVVRNAVNAPSVDAETLKLVRPYLHLGEQLGKFTAQLVKHRVEGLEAIYSGEVSELPPEPVTTAIVKGFLEPAVSETVNYVNAMHRAEARGLSVKESRTSESGDYTTLITLRATGGGETIEVAGTLFGNEKARIVRVNDIETEVAPEGIIIHIVNEDKPGVFGAAAALLGQHNINIAEIALGRKAKGERANTFIMVDDPVPANILDELRGLPNIVSADVIAC